MKKASVICILNNPTKQSVCQRAFTKYFVYITFTLHVAFKRDLKVRNKLKAENKSRQSFAEVRNCKILFSNSTRPWLLISIVHNVSYCRTS